MAQRLKRLPAMRETWVQSLDWEDPWRRKQQPTPVQKQKFCSIMLTLIYVCSALIFSCLFYMLVMTHLIEFMIPEWIASCSWKRFIYRHLLTKVEIPFLVSPIENQKTERIPWCFYFTRASTVALVLEIGNCFPIRKLHSKISRNWLQGTFPPVLSLSS